METKAPQHVHRCVILTKGYVDSFAGFGGYFGYNFMALAVFTCFCHAMSEVETPWPTSLTKLLRPGPAPGDRAKANMHFKP